MKKILIGVVVGAILGAIDGWSALLSAPTDPEVRDGIWGIILGSTAKGLVAGAITGLIARKLHNLVLGIVVGAAIAMLFAWLVAMNMKAETGKDYYMEIMLPGTIVGAIVGFATQRYGSPAPPAPVPSR